MEHCLVIVLMDMLVRYLPPRGACQFRLDRNQDPRLCLYLLKHPTDPSWTFLLVPNLQHQEEPRAFLVSWHSPHMAGSHQVFPPLDRRMIIPRQLTL